MGFEDFNPKPKGIVAERIFGMPYNDGQEEKEGAGDEQYSNKYSEELVTEAHYEVLEAEQEAEQKRLDFIKEGSADLPEAQRGGTPSHDDHKDGSRQRMAGNSRERHSQTWIDYKSHPSVTPKRKTEAYARGAHEKKMRNWENARNQMTDTGGDEEARLSHLDIIEADETGNRFKDAA